MILANCRTCELWKRDLPTLRAYGKPNWGMCGHAFEPGAGVEVVSAQPNTSLALLTHPDFGCLSYVPDEDTVLQVKAKSN